MKRVLLLLPFLALTSCYDAADKIERTASDAVDATSTALPVLSFEKTSHAFGEIVEGDVVEHTFTFTNEGEGPLIISSAKPSCGCTVPVWPRQPIAPGETGEIKVQFDSTKKVGSNQKTVTLVSNANPSTRVLRFSANVKPAAAE